MGKRRIGSHTVSWLTAHLIYVTKYRYKVLKGEIQNRCRTLMIQDCDAMEIRILKGVVSKDHVHLHIEYPPKLSVSAISKQLKGRSSKKLQEEYPELKRRYWGRRFWGKGFGAFSTGNITDKMVQDYIESHRKDSNEETENFFLE